MQLDEYQVPVSISLHLAGLQAQADYGNYDCNKMFRYFIHLFIKSKRPNGHLLRSKMQNARRYAAIVFSYWQLTVFLFVVADDRYIFWHCSFITDRINAAANAVAYIRPSVIHLSVRSSIYHWPLTFAYDWFMTIARRRLKVSAIVQGQGHGFVTTSIKGSFFLFLNAYALLCRFLTTL